VYDDSGFGFYDCGDLLAQTDVVVCFSQSGANLGMLAPGMLITAAGGDKQGTSMAAPHVAGAAAVLAAARPSATVSQIESALKNNGPAVTDPWSGVTRRRLDVAASLAALPASDTTPPTVTAPAQTAALNWQLGASVVPVTISWSASDPSGIAAYAVKQSTNGGAWVDVALPSANSKAVTLRLAPGSSYRYIVAARDGAGVWSGWVSGPTFVLDAHQETSAAITYSGTWTRLAWTSAYGGYQRTASATNAWARIRFTGRGVGWVAPTSTNRGRAYIYVDDVHVQTLDLYSATTVARKIVFVRNWSSAGEHRLAVQVVGTSSRPAIDVDAFIVLR
jgi:hypothetical protein